MTSYNSDSSSPATQASRPSKKKGRGVLVTLLERYSAILVTVGLLLIWQLAVPIFGLSPFVLPTPFVIASRIVVDAPLLFNHAGVTLLEVVSGFVIAIGIGVPLALAIFYSRPFEKAIYPLMVALQTVPKVALAPLLVLYLGYGWLPKISLAFLISFFPIVISSVVGLQALDKDLVKLVRSMGANEWQTFFKLRLPAALPSIFGGFKVAASLAVVGAIIGEYVAAERGLGYLQLQATSQFDTPLNFASVIVISLLGVALYYVVEFLEFKFVYKKDTAK